MSTAPVAVHALALLLLASDPRIVLIEAQLAGDLSGALARAETQKTEDPDGAALLGIDYLRGHVLDRLGRRKAAASAFAEVLAPDRALSPYARLRIARIQEDLGHPEVAAGLIATLLGSTPPPALLDSGTRLLQRTLEQGGDCRLLTELTGRGFPKTERRRIQLARADCAARSGDGAAAQAMYRRLLQEEVSDLVAWQSARGLAALSQPPLEGQVVSLLGKTFHHHREFDRSAEYLEQVVVHFAPTIELGEFRTYYQLARCHFWRGEYAAAARSYGDLATRIATPGERAQALYNQARSYELASDFERAIESYGRTFEAQPLGDWSGPSLIGALRLHWRRGDEAAAKSAYERLRSRRQWRPELSRAALFLASSDLVQGRSDRAEGWLLAAAGTSDAADLEATYWRGRLAELRDQEEAAVELFASVVQSDPFHPLGQAAVRRLRAPALAALVSRLGASHLNAEQAEELHRAWILLGDSADGKRAQSKLHAALLADPAARPFLELRELPPAEWTLWAAPLRQPEELLLALGIWEEGAPAAMRYFPVSSPNLAHTAGRRLAAAGEVRRSLLFGEILLERMPRSVPARLLPDTFRRQLYPLSFSYLIQRAALRHGIDPHLLSAIVREESRFDPAAVSKAAARGLTQFVYPTAQRLAQKIGLSPIAPAGLENPELALELGAAYLRELEERFGASPLQMVSAYNAGEAQTDLWRGYCYSPEPEEFFTKVGFRETRSYLIRVLSSRAQYIDIYGDVAAPSAAGPER